MRVTSSPKPVRLGAAQAQQASSSGAVDTNPSAAGLARIRGQSHKEPARGLSQGLKWRDAKTLGLGTLAKGLLGLGGWVLKGIGRQVGALGERAVQHGRRLHRQENPHAFSQGLGWAAKGLGYVLQGGAMALKAGGTVVSTSARPVGMLIGAGEKLTYLAGKGLARYAQASLGRLTAGAPTGLDALARSGLRLSASQVASLARHMADPASQPWPEGVDRGLGDRLASQGYALSADQVTDLAKHLSSPSTHPWPTGVDPALRVLLQPSS